jgi:hypothetical protein
LYTIVDATVERASKSFSSMATAKHKEQFEMNVQPMKLSRK